MLFYKHCQILGVDPVTPENSTQACWAHKATRSLGTGRSSSSSLRRGMRG